MARSFNTAGVCRPAEHYMLPPLRRLPAFLDLIHDKAYFALHAPRQTGKTTALLTLAQRLTAEGRYLAVLLSMETGAPYGDDVSAAETAILADWRRIVAWQLPAALQPPPWPAYTPGAGIGNALAAWSAAAGRPLVVFLDEIDALHDTALVAILRQLRSGYTGRPEHFPWSLVLCGLRDVRDYKVLSGGRPDRLRSGSPFNIKAESLTLRNFTEAEVAELYEQHSAATGQVFSDAALARAAVLTGGQPWLVNALARQALQIAAGASPVTVEHFERAKEALISRRDTHLDSLADKLHEDRVRRVIEPILTGATLQMDALNDDLLYARDLGLVVDRPNLRIANPIYQEIIPRALSYVMQATMVQELAWYLRDDGRLDLVLLLAAFQEFFAEHSEAWMERFDYKEAGPHLMLMAFLQRVVNGGGRITRELAVGSGRADLVVDYGGGRSVIELKIRRGPETEAEGLRQLSAYLDRLGEPEGFLLIFDRRKGIPWRERLSLREAAGPGGQRVYVFGA